MREIWNIGRGYEDRYRVGWERTRWLGTMIHNASYTKKKSVQPRDLLTFPWDGVIDRAGEIELIKERRKWREQAQ